MHDAYIQVVVRNVVKKTQSILVGHDSQVNCFTMSPDGSFVASGQKSLIGLSADVILWEFESKKQLHRLVLHKGYVAALAFSRMNLYLATVGGIDDKQLVIWDVKTGVALTSVQAHSDAILAVSFLRNSEEQLITCGTNHVKVWNLEASTKKLKSDSVAMGSLKRTFTTITVAFDDSLSFCGTQSGDMIEVDIKRKVQKRIGPMKTSFPGGILCLSLIPQGDLLVGTGEGVIAKVALNSLRVIGQTKLNGAITSISLSPDGTRFFAGSDKSYLYLVETETLKADLRSTSHTHRVNAICFPQNTSEVFATASFSEIKVWNTKNKHEILCIQVANVECFCVDFALDGKSIVSGWADGKVRSFTPQSGKLIFAITDAHKDGVTSLRMLSDCTRVVSGGMHGEVRIWKVAKSHQELIVSLKEHRQRVNDIRIRHDDDARAVSVSSDGSVIVWDLVKKIRLICAFESTKFRSVVYHPDFSQIVTVGTDRRISYWEIFDGETLRVMEGVPEGFELSTISISKSGSHFVVGGSDTLVKLYDYELGELVGIGRGHSTGITASVISPNQEFIVTGGSDGSLFFWQLSGELVHKFQETCI
jgi:WD40 repeat protein